VAQTPATRGGNGTAPARQADPAKTILDLLTRSKQQIQLALPKHLDADRMLRVAFTAIRLNKDLLRCDALSLVKCVIQAAGVGLSLDPLLGQAYMVPFNNSKTGIAEATLILGYKGLVTLARRSGEVASVQAHVVYEADEFSYSYGTNEHLTHVPAALPIEKRGSVTHAWALARFKDGTQQIEIMNIYELEAIRLRSKAKDRGPWVTDRPEMYRKCPIRRLAKMLPLSPEVQRSVAQEELQELDIDTSQMIDVDADTPVDALPAPEAAPTTESDKVLARMAPAAEPAPPDAPATTEPADLGWVHGVEKKAGHQLGD
jgi:recombination protein RecT